MENDPENRQGVRHRTNGNVDLVNGATQLDGDTASLFGVERDSPGVRRMEAMTSIWSLKDRVIFLISFVIMTYCRMLPASLFTTYQAIALDEFGVSSKSGMVRTVRQVLTSGTLPISAKLSDYIGRPFMLWLTVLFWIIGPIVTATSNGLGGYIPGFLLYTLGHVAGNILNYALAIDTSSLRNRLFMQLIFIFPGIINVWSSGVIADKTIEGPGWRWGTGMWAIIIPVFSLGMLAVMGWSSFRAKRRGLYEGIPSSWRLIRDPKQWVHLFWVMDVVGLTLLAGALALILLPLSLGGGSATKWKTANVITPLIIGVLLLPLFVLWEWKGARHPIFPFKHMKDRHIMVILLYQFLRNIASSTRDAYMYFTLVVSFNQGTEGATRINVLEQFASSITLIFVAFIVRRFQVVKPLIIFGAVLMIVAQGMLVRFRGGYSRTELAGLVAGEILDGIGTGLGSHPALVAMQAKIGHEHALLLTSCWAVGSQAGGGIASAIGGAIWTNTLPGKLRAGLSAAKVPDAPQLAQQVFKSPLQFVKKYPPGTAPREAVVNAYRDVQRTLCIVGLVIACVAFPLTLLIDNVKLDQRKTLAKDDGDSEFSVDTPNMRSDLDFDEKVTDLPGRNSAPNSAQKPQ